MTHTPGPWELFPPNGQTIVLGNHWTIGIEDLVTVANSPRAGDARLIAAAPEMLAALEAIVADSIHWRSGGKEMEQAKAAIAKAKGK